MPSEIFQQLNKKLLKEKEEVRQALNKAYETMPKPIDYAEKIVRFKAALEALNNPTVSAEKKNRLLKACINRIEYSRPQSKRLKRGKRNKESWLGFYRN